MEPAGDFRTLVALRAKKGEFAALNALTEDRLVQPLISLEHDPKSSVDRMIDRVENAVRHLWNLGRVTMLDATRMTTAPGGSAAVLEQLNYQLNAPTTLDQAESVPFIPVADAGSDELHLGRISRLALPIGHGCALRFRVGATQPEVVAPLIDHLAVEPTQLDLIIDAGYVAGLDQRLVDDILQLLDRSPTYGGFRSITVLSGSVPKSLEQLHQWEQRRFEEALWQSVRAGAPADVRFGDYGAVHPVSSLEGWRSKHISFKYTCADRWLYLREPILDPDAEASRVRTVRLVSSQLVSSSSFSGPDYSWGDGQLAIAADGLGRGLGDTSKPVAFATSHHLAYLGAFEAA